MSFLLNWVLPLAVMLGCFIGIKVCSKKQRTMPNAQLYAMLCVAVLFVACGWFLWKHFLFDLVVDKAALSQERSATQWRAQGWGLGKYIDGDLTKTLQADNDNILVLYDDAEYMKNQVAAFKEGLIEAGVPESRIEMKVLEVSGNMSGMPAGMPGMSKEMLMTSSDFKKAIPSNGPKIVISLLGIPRDAQQPPYYKFIRQNKNAFIVAGNVYQNPTHLQLIANDYITAALQLKEDAPQFEDSYSKDSPSAYDEFYELATKSNAQQLYTKNQQKKSN